MDGIRPGELLTVRALHPGWTPLDKNNGFFPECFKPDKGCALIERGRHLPIQVGKQIGDGCYEPRLTLPNS